MIAFHEMYSLRNYAQIVMWLRRHNKKGRGGRFERFQNSIDTYRRHSLQRHLTVTSQRGAFFAYTFRRFDV